MRAGRLVALCLPVLLLAGCGDSARPPEPEGVSENSFAAQRQGFQDNALDRFFQNKLSDPNLCQAEICGYQEDYNAAWELAYTGLAVKMLTAAEGSAYGTETALAFYGETDLSWYSVFEAVRASWREFQEDAYGNGTTDYMKLYHGVYLRDRCALLADWTDVTAYLPSTEELDSCWVDGGYLDQTAFKRLLEKNGLPCRGSEAESFALSCARMLAADWGRDPQYGDGVVRFSLFDLNSDGQQELLTDSSPHGGYAVYIPDEADFQRQIWLKGGTYTELQILEGGILWLHDGNHLTVHDSYCRMDGDTMTCLHDLALTPVSADMTDYRDGERSISQTAYSDILAQYAALPQLSEADGLRWLSNNRETLAGAFAELLLSESCRKGS